jgi:hypothetical protein
MALAKRIGEMQAKVEDVRQRQMRCHPGHANDCKFDEPLDLATIGVAQRQ